MRLVRMPLVSLGFLLTMASIQVVPVVAGGVGWRWGFAVLAAGPALRIAAIRAVGDRYTIVT